MTFSYTPLEQLASVNWGNTSITKSSYVESGYRAFSAAGGDGFLDDYQYDKEGIVLSAIGARCGKCFLADGKWTGIKNTITIIPENDVSRAYLFYFLNRANVWPNKGGAQPFISLKDARALKIPLPPLPIQKQIAAVLEKADKLRLQSQQMERELNLLAQSVFLDMFGDPVNNTNSFETASIGELAHVQIGPFGSMLHKSDYIPGGIPLINPTHIVDQKIIPNDELTITEEKFNTLPQYHLKYGDIVMGRRGEMGRCAVVTEESQGYFCGTGSLIIRRTSDLVSSEYLASMLSCSSVKSWFERQSLGATMPNLNKGIVSKLRIPIPSQKVNIKYDLAKSKIQKSLKECAKRKNLAEDYFNSLMQRAFKGELDLKDVA